MKCASYITVCTGYVFGPARPASLRHRAVEMLLCGAGILIFDRGYVLLQFNSAKCTPPKANLHIGQSPQRPMANAQKAIDGDLAEKGKKIKTRL